MIDAARWENRAAAWSEENKFDLNFVSKTILFSSFRNTSYFCLVVYDANKAAGCQLISIITMESLMDDIRDGRSLNLLKQLKTSIFDCAKNLRSNDETFNISTFPKVCDTLSDLMGQYVNTIQQLEAAQRTFDQLLEKVAEDENDPNGGDPVDLIAFEEVFRQKFNCEIQESVTDEVEAQVTLNALIRPEVPQPPPPQADEEIYVEQNANKEIPKDPITKRNIKIAVRSKKCNHVYDQESIKSYISHKEKNKSKVQCPVAGCSNRAMKSNELILDDVTNALIASLI